jgi:outer membrane receptor for ferrienterochelin and colicins
MLKRTSLAVAMAAAFGHGLPALADDNETTLSEVRIQDSAEKTDNSQGSLRDALVKTESIGAKEIERSNASNLTEAVDNRPGVSVQVECSVCNVRNISLDNMPGRFTTLLIDGIPLYSSVSSAYGLDSVSVDGIERIDIARGAGASLIAPEALAGTVNIVTKRPTEKENVITAEAGEYGDHRGSAYLARPFDGGALALSADYREHDSVDGIGGGISQYTGFQRGMAGLGYFLDNLGGFKVRGRIDLIHEKRGGGALGNDYGAIESNTTGNPFNFSAGPHGSPDPNGWVAPDGVSGPDTLANGQNGWLYNRGAAGLSQIITTDRQQATMIGERYVDGGKLRLAAGVAHHQQGSFYGSDALYDGTQHQYYLESSYQKPYGDNLVTLGADYRSEDLASTGYSFSTGRVSNGVDDYAYRDPALFAQLYRPFLHDTLELNASVRFDHHNVFGTIVSPRLNLLYHHDDAYSSRLSLGRGFRAPTSFFEQEHGILADNYIVRRIDKPETSDNLSYALSYSSDRFSWVASANYNRIHNFAMLTPGISDGHGQTYTLFSSAADPVSIRGIDWIGTYQMTPGTAVSLGAEGFKYDFTPGTLAFARPNERVYLNVDSRLGAWDVSTKLTWTGPQNLARFYDYANTPQYNLDGTPKPNRSPAFSVLDLHAEYRFDRRYSLFLGVNNVFDYQQAKRDSYLWVDSAGNLDVTHIWGPTLGRQIYAGIRASL